MESALKTARSGYDIEAVNFIASLNRLWWLRKYSLILVTPEAKPGPYSMLSLSTVLLLVACAASNYQTCPLFCLWWPVSHNFCLAGKVTDNEPHNSTIPPLYLES